MKNFLVLSFLSLFSTVAFAEAPCAEVSSIARVLLNNSKVMAQVSANGSTNLIDYTVVKVSDGVTKYTMTFNRQCECVPSKALVTIIEDMTPTYVDAAPEYTATVEFTPPK